ncbi:6-bladed beta-propeller [Algoriphagus namhaensis]
MSRVVFRLCTVFIFYLIAGCSQSADESTMSVQIVQVDDIAEEILMSSLVDSVFVVPLDNVELVGQIDDIVWAQDRIIVLDRSIGQKVSIFDAHGKFINSISSGSGEPGKFIFPSALTLSFAKNSFYVISGRTRRILEYDLDGSLVNDYDVKHLGQLDDIHPFKDGFALKLMPDDSSNKDIIFTDLDFNEVGSIETSRLIEEPAFQSGGAWNYFYPTSSAESFFYKDAMSNTIFKLNETKVSKIFEIDLPDSYEVNYTIIGRSLPDVRTALAERGLVALGDNHVVFGDFLLMEILNGGWGRLAIFSLKEKKVKFISNVVNDLSVISDINAIWGSYNNYPGKLVTSIEAPYLFKMLESVNFSDSPYAHVFDNLDLTIDDNPILIIYDLKKDYQWPFD